MKFFSRIIFILISAGIASAIPATVPQVIARQATRDQIVKRHNSPIVERATISPPVTPPCGYTRSFQLRVTAPASSGINGNYLNGGSLAAVQSQVQGSAFTLDSACTMRFLGASSNVAYNLANVGLPENGFFLLNGSNRVKFQIAPHALLDPAAFTGSVPFNGATYDRFAYCPNPTDPRYIKNSERFISIARSSVDLAVGCVEISLTAIFP